MKTIYFVVNLPVKYQIPYQEETIFFTNETSMYDFIDWKVMYKYKCWTLELQDNDYIQYIEICYDYRQKLIDEILAIDFFDLQDADNPTEATFDYTIQLKKLPTTVLKQYINDEITSEKLYDNYISKL
jgi:hypothetical protein